MFGGCGWEEGSLGEEKDGGKEEGALAWSVLLLDEEGTLEVGSHRRKRVQNGAWYISFQLKTFTAPI